MILQNVLTYLKSFGAVLLQDFRSIMSRNQCHHQSNSFRVVHPSRMNTRIWLPLSSLDGGVRGGFPRAEGIPVLNPKHRLQTIPADVDSAHIDLSQAMSTLTGPFLFLRTKLPLEKGRSPGHCFYCSSLDCTPSHPTPPPPPWA
jgi:hypothetical protein